jgi:succinoglycan biosynthesis protein ExoA
MPNDLPFVSIIMPIRNEAEHIACGLGAVLAQDYPADRMEILVVDGMSDDATRAVVGQTVGGRAQPRVVVLDNRGRIVPIGMNIALRRARGTIIVRVDGHCVIDPDYVRRCVEALRATGADNVGGLQQALGQGWAGAAIAAAAGSPFGVGGARFHYAVRAGWADTVYLGAYRREVFDRIGDFDEELVRNQDDELNFRLLQSGGRIWLDPSIRSIYHGRSSLRGLWRQYYQYGLYKVRVIQKRGGVASWRHLIPGAFVLGLLLSLLLALCTGRRGWALAVAGPYALANSTASIWAARRGWLALPLLPLAFLTMHLAYGLGFLAGLWHWRAAF